MMLILPYLDIFESCFLNPHSTDGRLAMRILYNENNKILVSKNYINFLETHFPDKNFFQALIKELFDSGRLESKKINIENTSIDEEFISLSLLPQIPILIPIIFKQNTIVESKVLFLCSKNKIAKPNKHWIQMEIAANGKCITTHLDFPNDASIKKYFEDLYSIPRYIRSCQIFDRDKSHNKKEKLKGKHVKYYTIFLSTDKHFERKTILSDLQKNLGGSLELWSTNKKTLLHERKIIFENLILTCDNSFENINSSEPTWEITFYASSKVANDWGAKCIHFSQVS